MVAVPADNDKRVDATMTIPTATSEWFDGPPPRSFFSRNREKLFTALLIITLAVAIAVPLSKKSIHAIDTSSSVASAEDGVVAAEQIANPVATEGNIITVAQNVGDANDGGAKKDPTNGTGRGNSNTTITTFDGNTSNFIFASDQVLRQSFGATKCPIGQGLWNLQLVTDDYPWETKWELRYYRNDGNGNGASGSVLANGPPDGTNYDRRTKYTGNLCLPAGQYYMRWFDQMGDSICCQHGPGEWVVRVNGGVVLKNDPNDMGYSSKDFPFNVFGSTKGDVSGTFLIMPRPYNPELNIELPDGTIFWLINLPPRFDYATNGLVSGITSITLPPGSEFLSNGTVDMKGGPPLNLERRLLIEEDGIDEMEDDHESLSSTEGMHYRHRNLRGSYGYHRKLATFEGDKTVLAIRVIAADGETTLDATSISNSIFGNGVDAVNLMSQFKACSYNKFTLSKASNRSGSKYGGSVKISNGVTTVRLPSVSTTQGDGAMRNDITKELNTIFGVNSPSQLADFVIYCLPPNTTPEIAYAYINHWLSVFNDDWCTSMSLQMHEIGHDINLSPMKIRLESWEPRTGAMTGRSCASMLPKAIKLAGTETRR